MSNLKVGAARVCIDPPREEYPFPSNFGMCDEPRDPCHVRALAIGNGEKQVLFMVYELSDRPTIPDLTARIAAECGMDEGDVILTVTHNHSSPCHTSKFPAPEEKFELFKKIELEAGIAAAKQAVESMRPARCGYGEIDSFCNVNRDLNTRFGFWVEGPNYAGYSNKTLAVVKFTDMEGKLIATLMNYGVHGVCAFLQKDTDGKIKTSSNLPGIVCSFVEEYYGGDTVAVWTSGAAGNQDPILFDYQWYEYPDGYVTRIDLPEGSGYVHMDTLGRQQGADAVRCLEGIDEYADEMKITYLKSKVPVPAQKRDPSFVMPPFGLRMGGNGPRKDFTPPTYPSLPEMLPDPDKNLQFTLNLLMLGDLAIIMTSGEIYAEIGRDMMAAADVPHKFVMTHIPGDSGYTLDRSSVDHKTFQSFGAVKPGGADLPLIEGTVELVRRAREGDC